ncbi:MAG: hypothetical protein U9P00_02970, partial [Pseudomonadota bacterium]|nr:hypothetical protein [Pseudomonadota bacterium]
LGYGIGTVINKYFTGPIIQGYLDRNREISRERGKKLDIGKDLFTRVRAGDVEAEHTRAARVGVRQAHVSKELPSMLADNLGSFEMGRLDYMKENIAEYQDWTVAEIKAYRREHFKKRGKNRVKKAGHGTVGRVGITLMKVAGPIGHIAQAHWDPGRAYKAGREIEEDYIEWLNEVKRKEIFGDADLRAAHEEKRNRLAEAKKRHAGKTTREVDIISRAEKHAERTAKEQANKEFNKRGGLTMVGARKWANENGGEYWEYVGLKIDQAKKISIQYGATFEEKAKAYTTISMEKAEELGKKYKTDAKQFFGKTLSQAEALGKTLLEKSKNVGIEIRDKAIEVAEETGIKKKKGWWATEWEAMKKWGSTPEKGPGAKGAATGAMVGAGVQKTGEYIEIGKGNFVEIYRSTKSKISELWETTVTPERKEWLRQNAGKLIATGKMTVDQLKKLGVEVTDTMLEEGKKGVEATQSAAIYTTQTISNTVSNATQAGGGGGNDQTFMAEFSLNRVIEGDLP